MAGFNLDGTFTARTQAEVEAEIVARQIANIAADLDTSQYSVIGQLNGIIADHLAQLWDLGLALHDAIDPDKAIGAQQDALYALTGTLRRDRTRSTVAAQVTLAAGTTIATGDAQASVLGAPPAKFVNAEPMINASGSPATVNVAFQSIDYGAIAAPAGRLTVIDTSVAGWTSITNADAAELGSGVEGDPAYRRRQALELAAQGGGSVPGLRADLQRLSTVRAADVVENTSGSVVDGMPPKSIEAIVQSRAGVPDDDAAIAAVVFEDKAAGIETIGTTSVEHTDDRGIVHTVHFSRPVERSIYVAMRVLTDPLRYAGDDALRLALVTAAESSESIGYLDVGADVYAGRFVAAAMAEAGVLNAEARLSFAPIVDFDAAATSLVITQREIATVAEDAISVGVFP